MFAWIRGDAYWTGADTYIAGICIFLFLNGALIFSRRRGLFYHLGLLALAIDAAQMAIIHLFIPVCKLWWGTFLAQCRGTLPAVEKEN